MARVSNDNELLAAVRGYIRTVGQAQDTGVVRRRIGPVSTSIVSTSYLSTFPRGVQFKVNARNQIVALGLTARKRELLTALTDLRDRRAANTENRTEEDEQIDETINSLIGPLEEAITQAQAREEAVDRELRELSDNFEDMARRVEANAEQESENDETVEYPLNERRVSFFMDREGNFDRTRGSVSNRQTVVNRITTLIDDDRLSPEARTLAERLRDRMNEEIAIDIAARDTRENDRVRQQVLDAEGEPQYENYRSLHENIRQIGEVDRDTPLEQKRNTATMGIVPGVPTSRVVETDLQSILAANIGLRYNAQGEFVVNRGTIQNKRIILVRLQNLRGFDELTDEDRAVVDRLIQALSRDVDRQIRQEQESERDGQGQGENQEQDQEQEQDQGEGQGQGEGQSEQETSYREIEVVTRETIQDRINYYEGILANQNRIEPVVTTISREDARRYQEINRQRATLEQDPASNLPEDLLYDQDRIDQELARTDLTADARARLNDLQNSRRYQEIVNNRARELDALIEERRNALEARRNEIIASLDNGQNDSLNRINEINERINNLRTSIARHEADIEITRDNLSGDAQEQVGDLEAIASMEREIEEWQSEIARLETERDNLESRPENRRARIDERINNLRTSIARHEADIEITRDNLSGDAQEQVGDLEAIASMEREIEEWQSEIARLETERDNLESRPENRRARIDERINNLRTSIARHEADIEITRDNLSGDAQEQVGDLEAIASMEREIEEWQSEIARLETQRAELEGMQTEIDTLTRERDTLINADINHTPEEENAYIDNMQGISDETKRRLRTLMSTYQYTITTERQAEVSNEDVQRANDVLPELRDLLSRTSDDKPYVEATEIDSRLDAYRAERDALQARTGNENQNRRPDMQNADIARAAEIRARMAAILGRDAASLNGIENEDEHAIQNQLDDNEIDEFQSLREELRGLGDDPASRSRAIAIRSRMAVILGRDVPEFNGIENEDEHAIQNQLDDNEIDEFQSLREELKQINQRQNDNGTKPLTPEEQRRLEQLNNIIKELEDLQRQKEKVKVVADRTDDQEKDDDEKDDDEKDDDEKDDDEKDDDEKDDDEKDDDEKDDDEKDDDEKDDDEKDDDEKDDDEKDDDDDKRLTKRGFWRIVQGTSHHEGKQAGSWAMTVRNIAKAPLLRPTKIKDGGLGWIGLPISILALPVKLGARAIHAAPFNHTEQKYAEMYEQVRDLYEHHPEDFRTLITGMREDVMRKNKINGLYLRAVQDVLREVVTDEIADSDSRRAEYQRIVSEKESQMDTMIDNFMQREGLSKEDAKFLFSNRDELTDQEKADLDALESRVLSGGRISRDQLTRAQRTFQSLRQIRNENDRADREAEVAAELYDVKILKDFERGAVNKEWGRMNIGITFPILKWFNRNNPDNREMIERFADEEDKAIAARAAGQEQRALDHEREIGRIREESTKEVKFGPFVLSRGNAHHEKVTVIPNDINDTRSKQLLTEAMVAVIAFDFFEHFKESHSLVAEQQRLDAHLQDHNDLLDDVNANNIQLEQDYQNAFSQIQQYTQNGAPTQDTYEAFDTIIDGNIQGILAKYHDAYTTLSNQVPGGQWPFAHDAQIHQMVENMNSAYETVRQSADALAQQGDFEGAIQELIDFNNSTIQPEMTNVMNYELGVWQQAVNAGSQYSTTYQSMIDVTQDALSKQGDMNDLLNQIANSSMTMPTVNGTMESAQHIGAFTISVPGNGISGLAALGASVGNALFGKLIRDRERQQTEKTDRGTTPKQGHFFDPNRDTDDGAR